MALPSVFWRCWLGSRKGIRPVKVECVYIGALHVVRTATSHHLVASKSGMVWRSGNCLQTQAVLEYWPLNEHCCCFSCWWITKTSMPLRINIMHIHLYVCAEQFILDNTAVIHVRLLWCFIVTASLPSMESVLHSDPVRLSVCPSHSGS